MLMPREVLAVISDPDSLPEIELTIPPMVNAVESDILDFTLASKTKMVYCVFGVAIFSKLDNPKEASNVSACMPKVIMPELRTMLDMPMPIPDLNGVARAYILEKDIDSIKTPNAHKNHFFIKKPFFRSHIKIL